MIIIHTAQIKPSANDLILLASMKRCDVVLSDSIKEGEDQI